MAYLLLHSLGKLAESAIEAVRDKDRIVAESAGAAGNFGDRSGTNPLGGEQDVAGRVGERDRAGKSCGSRMCTVKAIEYEGHFAFERKIVAAVTRRVNAGLAAESVNLQAGVVCDRPQTGPPGIFGCFKDSVSFECRTRFRDVRYVRKAAKIDQIGRNAAHQAAEFFDLPRVLCRDQYFGGQRYRHFHYEITGRPAAIAIGGG